MPHSSGYDGIKQTSDRTFSLASPFESYDEVSDYCDSLKIAEPTDLRGHAVAVRTVGDFLAV